jgi:UDP-N-acetyl-D-glucosamine dehydrogenase
VLWERFARLGANVDYYDPFFPVVRPTRHFRQFAGIRSRTWKEILNGHYDVAVIATAHDCVDHDALAQRADVVVDARGVCAATPNVVRA